MFEHVPYEVFSFSRQQIDSSSRGKPKVFLGTASYERASPFPLKTTNLREQQRVLLREPLTSEEEFHRAVRLHRVLWMHPFLRAFWNGAKV